MKRTLALLLVLSASLSASADTFFVEQDLMGLAGFDGYLDFQLTGDPAFGANSNAEVRVLGLSLTGGTLGAPLAPDLGTVIDRADGFRLVDSSPSEPSGRTFPVTVASNAAKVRFLLDFDPTGADPLDAFAYGVYRSDFTLVPTQDPALLNRFVGLTFPTAVPMGFSAAPGFSGFGQPRVAAVPEPASAAIMGVTALAALRRRRKG